MFTSVRFNCLFEINEPKVPQFILDFYSQVKVQTDEYGYLLISFMIQHEFITLTLAQFGQILRIPYNGQAVFTNEWDLASLAYSQETKGPYHNVYHQPSVKETAKSYGFYLRFIIGDQMEFEFDVTFPHCKPSGKKLNIRTLFTPRGNGIDVVVPVDSIRAVSEQFANSAYGFFLGKKVAYPVVANYVRNT
ncbi:hypothetical protein Tco_0881850 [Tanacetum coccineum]